MSNPLVVWTRLVIRTGLFVVLMMWPSGSWQWWNGWIVAGVWSIYGVIITHYLIKHDPALLAERMRLMPLDKNQKSWDKILMLLFFIAGIGLYIIPGLDVIRLQWSEPLPQWMRILALAVHVPCFALLNWIMKENTYLAQVVKIDKQREHKVISTGPYAWVRHPMYTVVIVLLFAFPMALGSRYALIVSLFLTVLLIVRTHLEDRTLHEELQGYADYAQRTVYRLIPGIW